MKRSRPIVAVRMDPAESQRVASGALRTDVEQPITEAAQTREMFDDQRPVGAETASGQNDGTGLERVPSPTAIPTTASPRSRPSTRRPSVMVDVLFVTLADEQVDQPLAVALRRVGAGDQLGPALLDVRVEAHPPAEQPRDRGPAPPSARRRTNAGCSPNWLMNMYS